ncbi:transglycosylase SLT domain-containing protein [Bacillus sp. 1P06AnD]|uniref:transglycosylase SLT domain-containing protein n=1 Tax=Bacillus sp. 1P06AnD TaxID=3132208 RepID=UPI0039A1A58D
MNTFVNRLSRLGIMVVLVMSLLALSDSKIGKELVSSIFPHSNSSIMENFTITAEAAAPSSASYYVKGIPMPADQQKYLYNLSKQRGLNYADMLAFIKHESSFNPKARGGSNYGYFQINKVNHAHLAKVLKTKNNPYDPYINMNWGTYMISDLYKKYQRKGLKGANLKNAVLSAYNRGEGGYAKYGKAVSYINKHNQCLAYINARM